MNNKIVEDLTLAMKNSDKFRLSVLRMLKSALQLEKINKKHDLDDNEVKAVIKKQVKTRKDSISEYEKYNKTEEVEKLEEEIAILSAYLPEELSEEEVTKIVLDTLEELNATSIKDMGRVMKELNVKLIDADMSLVSKIVKERLN